MAYALDVAIAMELTEPMPGPAGTDPFVSVGVPVYNSADTIESALDSLRNQTHLNLEILISDNASTDATGSICQRIAASDPRVTYSRQQTNIGPHENFGFVLRQSGGEYFMWAAGDDQWDRRFVEKNLSVLLADPLLVGSISRVRWRIDGELAGFAAGTAPLQDSVTKNIEQYLRFARDNSRFYALFRRSVLLETYPVDDFYGADIATMLGTLLRGKHAEVPEALMTRNRHDPASYIVPVSTDTVGGLARALPLLPFTRYALREIKVPITPKIAALLLLRNVYEHFRLAALQPTPYGSLARFASRAGDLFHKRLVRLGE